MRKITPETSTACRNRVAEEGSLSRDGIRRYRRQLVLGGFGERAQGRLARSRVVLVGAGGLGSPALLYLAGAGVGTLVIVDDDVVEVSNLHRQIAHDTPGVGRLKCESAAERAAALNPEITVIPAASRLTDETAGELLRGADLVIDGTDSIPARRAVSRACAQAGIPHVWGAVLGMDAQMSVFWAGRGPVFEDLYPEAMDALEVPNCAEGGVLGPVVGVVGAAMAVEALKLLTGMGRPLLGRVGVYSGLEGEWEYVLLASPAAAAPLGGEDEPPGGEGAQPPARLAGPGAHPDAGAAPDPGAAPDSGAAPDAEVLVDVREEAEFQAYRIPGAISAPLSALRAGGAELERLAELVRSRPVRVYCQAGVRSAEAVRLLQEAGAPGASHLEGGIEAWLAEGQKG